MKDYDVYFYKDFKEDEDFWKKCFEKENSCIETAEDLQKIKEIEKLKKQLEIALSSMRDSRELFYQLSQIVIADAIGKQLHEIKELEK